MKFSIKNSLVSRSSSDCLSIRKCWPIRPAWRPIAREHGSLAKLATKYRRFKQLNSQIAEAQEMIAGSDPEMRELAEAELPQLRAEREKYWDELLDLTAGGEDANRTRCVMEIRAGTGGDEAALFARDLYEMYRHYCRIAAAGRSKCST